jgi:hypothetical protein
MTAAGKKFSRVFNYEFISNENLLLSETRKAAGKEKNI